VFDAPRQLVYRAFTDPDHLAAWWGPTGNSLPRQAFTKLDATLRIVQAVAADHREVEAWQS
jgi:uncharacterized protein YndB with AHSA1/START domain